MLPDELYLALLKQISAKWLWIVDYTESFNFNSVVRAEIKEEVESSLHNS